VTGSVLVTGATGFIGRHLVRALADRGVRTYGTCRPGADPSVAGVSWLETDLASARATGGWPRACDAVVYLAQSRRWRDAADGAADVVRVNVSAMADAAEYARGAGAKRFILMSTGSVYGFARRPVTENDVPGYGVERPLYVASKLAAETILSAYRTSFIPIVLRLFVPYGPGQDSRMLIPELARRVQNGEPVRLDGDDGLVVNPVVVDDVVRAIIGALSLDAAATLNVAGPQTLTLRTIAETLGAALGRPVRFESTGAPARWLVGDTGALTRALGWSPPTAFAAGVGGWLCRESAAPAGSADHPSNCPDGFSR
jgi:nucleoside-diphosphate-sugar epimerase